ncbi:hypothetical protein HT112_25455 [Pseudomonas aeruginosa]|uniref:hypothetical protein n=1 Tax=Pseudomonas aeruginosa TaxID=287 RepID=UPI000F52B3B7|nr:hypothetical protein [Pseudomonas aeruginosa]NTS83945.1 hypothetical protein [Pseudomonas aeruginosa]HEP8182937.1 hypothetical protein [Pseudomonas aeruginosa]
MQLLIAAGIHHPTQYRQKQLLMERLLLADCCQSSLDLREPQALEIAMQLNGERWHIANKIPFPATVVLSLLSAPDLAEKPAP